MVLTRSKTLKVSFRQHSQKRSENKNKNAIGLLKNACLAKDSPKYTKSTQKNAKKKKPI